jgi:uncharacterized MAPEG superfamily protein
MSIELKCLTFALLLGIVHILIAGHAKTKQYGTKWNVSARDAELPPLNLVAARLVRAQANFFETFPIYAVAVLIAAVADRSGFLTVLGSALYVVARVIYLPLYAFGVPVVRTLVWLVSMLGIGCILIALF